MAVKDGSYTGAHADYPRRVLFLFVFASVAIGPQIVLYAKSGFIPQSERMEEVLFSRYLLPGMIGFAYPIAYILRQMREGRETYAATKALNSYRFIMSAGIVFVVLGLGIRFTTACQDARLYGRQTEAINGWLESIASNTDESDRIVVVYHPRKTYQIRRLDPILAERLNRKNVEYYPAFPVSSYLADDFDRLEGRSILPADAGVRIENPGGIDALVFLGKNMENAFLYHTREWFRPEEFRGYVLVGWLEEDELSAQWNRNQ
jgi:hypothetical protein